MELNVDVICHDTGEVFKEGVLLANAHLFIAKRGWKIVKDEIEVIEVEEIDDGSLIPTMEVRNLWVEIPEIQEDIRKYDEYLNGWKEVQGFWRD